MLQAALLLLLLPRQHTVHALQSKQRKVLQSDANRVDLNFCTKNVYANLGGLGGGTFGEIGPEDKTKDGNWRKELRYKKVAVLPTGQTLDLVVTNQTEYRRNADPVHSTAAALFGGVAIGEEEINDRKGCLGSINIKAPGKVLLKFAMVLQGTDTPAPSKYTYDFTMIDRSEYREETVPAKAGELFRVASAVGAVEVPNSDLRIAGSQVTSSVGFVFENVDHWQITVGSVDSPNGIGGLEVGRTIFLGGRTSLHSKMGKSKESGDIQEFHDTREPDDTAEPRDTAEPGDATEPHDTAEPGDTAEPRDTAEPGDATEPRDTAELGDTAKSHDTKESADTAEPRDISQPRDTKEPQDTKEPRETKEPQDTKEAHDTKEPDGP